MTENQPDTHVVVTDLDGTTTRHQGVTSFYLDSDGYLWLLPEQARENDKLPEISGKATGCYAPGKWVSVVIVNPT